MEDYDSVAEEPSKASGVDSKVADVDGVTAVDGPRSALAAEQQDMSDDDDDADMDEVDE